MLRRALVPATHQAYRPARVLSSRAVPRRQRQWTGLFSLPQRHVSTSPDLADKTAKDLPRFQEWDANGVFSPKLWFFTKFNIFTVLHSAWPEVPAAYDIPEFLDEAKKAMESILTTIYSSEFFNAAIDSSIENDKLLFLHDIMSPQCVQTFIDGFRALHENGVTGFQLTELKIKGCHLQAVDLDDDQVKIQLHVLFFTEEHVTTTGNIDGKEVKEMSTRDDQCTWVFESELEEPIKWIIVAI
ncbi:hypothetical protein THRCLA_21057 [Thraustotheca clavata]|uniref:Tim44-like domain-containing protein n=1 Tax=Thraustotheca clavata TaxID=74557 RepID=A0A1W0A0L5_9STRA|nr:hypothetical protein THRCLA_21057 [Thraustotheca clavata]